MSVSLTLYQLVLGGYVKHENTRDHDATYFNVRLHPNVQPYTVCNVVTLYLTICLFYFTTKNRKLFVVQTKQIKNDKELKWRTKLII